ncbi:NAD(P)-binding protein [Armillaria gallica]|uniref:NAD(P)-binding protein n=1 Tax=Armillaria gallica TaxID=47427 RepID=A0A2H3D5F3_ARMGA|nr:NAD(P)-binding protein [Armillaria gallica]
MANLNMATVMSLSGRVGLVTGGGTGIGYMIAKAFAANGVKVYITGRRLDVLENCGVGHRYPRIHCPTNKASRPASNTLKGIDGKLDILVNNAGIAGPLRDPDFTAKKFAATDPFEPETVQTWTDLFALNTIAPFFVVRAFQSLLIKGARSRPQGTSSVINVSSVGAQMNTPTPLTSACVPYLMTKSALDKLTLVLGMSFAQRGIPIRVNVLAPGVFASQMISPEVLEAIRTKPLPGMVAPIPAKRQGTETEMGMTAVYLAASDYTNGALLTVDGAVSLVNP